MPTPLRTYVRTIRYHTVLVPGALAALLAACGGGDTNSASTLLSTEQLKATCASLPGKIFNGATVTATNRVEANATTNASGFCQVLATKAPYLDIEVGVPDDWSGRLWHQGGGGFDGRIRSAINKDAAGQITSIDIALGSRRAVYAASNGGNRATVASQASPLVWFNGTPEGAQSAADYAYAAIGTTVKFAKAITQEFFKQTPKYSYFNGSSGGGRNAYIAAQRWPGEYDGIVSGGASMDLAGQTAGWMNLTKRAGTPAMPAPGQWTAAYNAAVAACDAADGLADGMVANYARCSFDVGTQQCGQPGASADPAVCLSAAQAQTIRDVLGDRKLANGKTVHSGYGWANWSVPAFGALGTTFASLATNDASWMTSPAKQATFDLDAHYGTFSAGLQSLGADHDRGAIAAFVASGKKLISWHDSADGVLSLNDHVRHHAGMVSAAQGMGLADPSTASRFFVVPGTTHNGGASLTAVDWSDAIVKWVENGTAPEELVLNRKTAAGAAKSLPVCQYPKYPQFSGSGDVNAAASYRCATP